MGSFRDGFRVDGKYKPRKRVLVNNKYIHEILTQDLFQVWQWHRHLRMFKFGFSS